jgi:hypothetical protein
VSFEASQKDIRDFLMDALHKDNSAMKKMKQAVSDSSFRNIDNLLDTAVFADFKALVVIDEARAELYNVIEKIRASISVMEFKGTSRKKVNSFISLTHSMKMMPLVFQIKKKVKAKRFVPFAESVKQNVILSLSLLKKMALIVCLLVKTNGMQYVSAQLCV